MRTRRRGWWRPVAAATTLLLLAVPDVGAQDAEIRDLIARMQPRERVGQLFLVPMDGGSVDGSAIATLISEYHVGGVILDPARGNFTDAPDAPLQVAELANALQSTAFETRPRIPLLVALEQAGDDYPGSALRGGMTPLPSNMALGATWNPSYAERVGEIVGRELAATGVNLLLGPNLDVLAVPQPGGPGDLGARSFGGSSHWVGQLGRAYIAGVHEGSGGRVATAAGHFPGIGAADRSAEQEVAVVEKTYQELAASEMIPFRTVTEGVRPNDTTDAVVTSHVRYRGVQQQVDRPLSLDSGGLRYLLAQMASLSDWRGRGGVLVSPGLGLPAVRRYDDPNLQSFNHRRVIRESLAAGHDLIVLTGLGRGDEPGAEMEVITDGIDWLAGVYEEDEAVRDAVDDAVFRVLRLKRRLNPSLTLSDARVDAEAAMNQTGIGTEDVLAVARGALTRISPVQAAGATSAGTPQLGDRVVFVVDARPVTRCLGCEASLSLDPGRLVGIARRMYGSAGAHRVEDSDIDAITFGELKAWLQANGEVASEDTVALVEPLSADRLAVVDGLLRGADWMIFAMRDVRPAEAPGSDALKLYLKSSPPQIGDQNLVAVAFTAPYYLDTTEIARLVAYYVVYARTEPFLEVAVRSVFGDEAASGASPVSIPGVGYDLFERLEPADTDVTLELVGRSDDDMVTVGTNLTVRTGAIHDANGNVVPDGTPVTFRRFTREEGLFLPDVEEVTRNGRASTTMRAERPGETEISAVFANGLRSAPLVVAIEGSADTPTEEPAGGQAALGAGVSRPPVDWSVLVLSLSVMVLAGVAGYAVEPALVSDPSRMLRTLLLSLAWGLGGYLLVAAGGLHLGALGFEQLWPGSWSRAYQAPLFSFGLAMLPAMPLVIAAVLRRSAYRLPGRKNGQ